MFREGVECLFSLGLAVTVAFLFFLLCVNHPLLSFWGIC